MLILSVSQINEYLYCKFNEDHKLEGIIVKGEISNFTAHRSGHFYFTLKDKESALKAIMFKSNASRIKFLPENGMNVLVMGSISVFKRDGVYQLYAADMIPDGVGSVHVAFEQLKEKLRKEGLFDDSAKRPIPRLPKKIAVVTSRTGAALQDVINVLSRRYPIAELAIFPALVQGENAPDSISEALLKAAKKNCDVIILARGGGSLEDLSPFNTEKVAYAVFNSSIPVISAVGHETDFTIADMAADLRAPTPSAAAEMVSLSKEQLLGNLKYFDEKLTSGMTAALNVKLSKLEKLNERLLRFSPQFKIESNITKYVQLKKLLKTGFEKKLSQCENKYISVISRMEALSPIKVLERGYSLIYKNGKAVTKTVGLKKNDIIEIKMSDGIVKAKIITDEEE